MAIMMLLTLKKKMEMKLKKSKRMMKTQGVIMNLVRIQTKWLKISSSNQGNRREINQVKKMKISKIQKKNCLKKKMKIQKTLYLMNRENNCQKINRISKIRIHKKIKRTLLMETCKRTMVKLIDQNKSYYNQRIGS